MPKEKLLEGEITHRTSKMNYTGRYSDLNYNIVASAHIIREIHEAIEKIIAKYPKTWEEKDAKK